MSKKFVPSEEQREWLTIHFSTVRIQEIEDHLGCSKPTIYRLGVEMGLHRPKYHPAKILLTERQKKYLMNHFKNTKNDDLMEHLGLNFSTFHRIVRELGLTKTRQFMKKCQRATTEAAYRSHMINGTFPPKGFRIPGSEKHCFQKGVTPEQRLGKKKNKQRIEKSAAARRATVKREHARVTFGLPQKTKLKIVCQSRKKVCFRFNLKQHGYIIDEEDRIAFFDGQTRRSKRMESRDQRWFTFEPLGNKESEYNEKENC